MGRARRVLGVLTVATFLSVSLLPSASAGSADDGMLRLAHVSPDTPAVDVYVDPVSEPGGPVELAGLGYGTVSAHRAVPPGTYAVSIRGAGAPADSPAVLSTTVEVPPGSARTVVSWGRFADLGLAILEDDLRSPPPGQARVRLIAAAASAGSIAVSVGGAPVSPGLGFAAASGYVDVPGGATTLHLAADGGVPADLPVDLAAGSVYSVLVLDRSGGGLTVSTVLDAAGLGAVPAGGVEAGAGGTAAHEAGGTVTEPGPPVGVLSLVALSLVVLLLGARTAPPHRGGPARPAAR